MREIASPSARNDTGFITAAWFDRLTMSGSDVATIHEITLTPVSSTGQALKLSKGTAF